MNGSEDHPMNGGDAHMVVSTSRPRRGRPLEMTDDAVVERIRSLSRRPAGLLRIHMAHPGLYARARRMFGSWAAAVRAAGLDYADVIERARRRSMKTRRQRRKQRAMSSPNSGDVFTPR
jgi:hypothetical protein